MNDLRPGERGGGVFARDVGGRKRCDCRLHTRRCRITCGFGFDQARIDCSNLHQCGGKLSDPRPFAVRAIDSLRSRDERGVGDTAFGGMLGSDGIGLG